MDRPKRQDTMNKHLRLLYILNVFGRLVLFRLRRWLEERCRQMGIHSIVILYHQSIVIVKSPSIVIPNYFKLNLFIFVSHLFVGHCLNCIKVNRTMYHKNISEF